MAPVRFSFMSSAGVKYLVRDKRAAVGGPVRSKGKKKRKRRRRRRRTERCEAPGGGKEEEWRRCTEV